MDTSDDKKVKHFNIKGGILYLKLNNIGRKQIIEMLSKINDNQGQYIILFDDQFEFNIWKHYINIIFGNLKKYEVGI